MAKFLKTNYGVYHQVESFFTGSSVQFDSSGEHFYCVYGSNVNRISVKDGQVKSQIRGKDENDPVIKFIVTCDDRLIIIAYHSGIIVKFNFVDDTIEREFKSIHTAPVACLRTNNSCTILATGSSDGTIKLWNLVNHFCSHNLKGVNGIVSSIQFHNSPQGEMLICSAGDDSIHIFDIQTSQRLKKLQTHCSTITDLKVTTDGLKLISVGRDKIAVIWNIDRSDTDGFGQNIRTIPIYESSESIEIIENKYIEEVLGKKLDSDRVFFATIGEEGLIKFWDATSGSKIFTQNDSMLSSDRSPGSQCFQLCHRPLSNQICAISHERDIFFYDLPKLDLVQQLQGHLDEVFSVSWFANDRYIAIACNSNDLKVMEVSSSKTQHLRGHKDIVLCVRNPPSDPMCLISSSKDCTIIVWQFKPDTMIPSIIYTATGHTHAIHTICTLNVDKVFFSAGEDTTLKRWSYMKNKGMEAEDVAKQLIANQTIKAHDDRIDDIAVSPNDQLVATGSKDKTVKIFSVEGLRILATLKGHKRGIYALKFSPVDQVLVSAADTTIRMWNLNDFSCIKTFQGHECSVLNFSFLSNGLQIISVGSDGNMKLWDCRTSECVKTIDAHSGNTWSLASTQDDSMIVTAGQDQKLVIWNDITELEREERQVKLQTQVAQEQDFSNFINKKKWKKALKLAIKMESQSKTLNVIREVLLDSEGLEELQGILCSRGLNQLNFIVECCVGWNASAKNSTIAQQVLYILINQLDNEQLLKMPSFISCLDQIKTLTEKCFNRYERLVQQATFVDFFLGSIRIQ